MLQTKAMVLYCGGAPSLAAAPPQPASDGGLSWAGGGGVEGPRALIGGRPRAGPLPLMGAPGALTGPPARPDGELDGCEPDSDDEGATATAGPEPCDPLRRVTLELVGAYLRQAAAAEEPTKGGGGGKLLQGLLGRFAGGAGEAEAETASRALETLRRVCDGILDRHRLAFQGMLRKMEIEKEDDLKTMSEVATQVFSDGITNWGRIVTLISFGAFVVKNLKSINQESCINRLAEIITDVLVTDKREWLLQHNAWEGFVKFFHVEDLESSIRNLLMAFAGVAGLGASLAYLIR